MQTNQSVQSHAVKKSGNTAQAGPLRGLSSSQDRRTSCLHIPSRIFQHDNILHDPSFHQLKGISVGLSDKSGLFKDIEETFSHTSSKRHLISIHNIYLVYWMTGP